MIKKTINTKERHETIENAHKTVVNAHETVQNGGTVNAQELKRLGTVDGLKRSYCTRSRSETFTKSRSRYGHGTVTLTHQKRKKHCIF
jgi:hypothetical protein